MGEITCVKIKTILAVADWFQSSKFWEIAWVNLKENWNLLCVEDWWLAQLILLAMQMKKVEMQMDMDMWSFNYLWKVFSMDFLHWWCLGSPSEKLKQLKFWSRSGLSRVGKNHREKHRILLRNQQLHFVLVLRKNYEVLIYGVYSLVKSTATEYCLRSQQFLVSKKSYEVLIKIWCVQFCEKHSNKILLRSQQFHFVLV